MNRSPGTDGGSRCNRSDFYLSRCQARIAACLQQTPKYSRDGNNRSLGPVFSCLIDDL